MEGGSTERIPPGAEPSDVIYGNPSDVDDLVVKLRACAGAFKDGQGRLDVLSLMDWTGAGSEGFRKATEKLPLELESAQTYFHAAANAPDSYADKLRSAQKRVKPIIEDTDAAREASKAYWKDVNAYNAAVDRKDDTLPERPPDDDPGIGALEGCFRRLHKLESELRLVIDTAKKAPDKPPTPKGWDSVKKEFGDFVGRVGDTVNEWYEGFDSLAADGPDGLGLHLVDIQDGIAYAVDHPKGFAKAVTNWDE